MSNTPTQTKSDAAISQQQQLQQFKLFEESLPKVNQLAFQLLLNEVIPMSMSVEDKIFNNKIDEDGEDNQESKLEANRSQSESKEISEELEEKLYISPPLALPSHILIHKISTSDEKKRKLVLKRLRSIGFQLGNKMSDLLIFKNNPNLQFKDADLLLIMKFICRDVWKQIYGKQIDNLKTNHRGTFYLFDYDYRPIRSFVSDSDVSDEEALKKELFIIEPFLEIPVGIIEGVLSSLGYKHDSVICKATFVDRPEEKNKLSFSKAVSFHVQIDN